MLGASAEICRWLACLNAVKKLGKGVVSEKQREGDEFFRIQFPFPPLFVGTECRACSRSSGGAVVEAQQFHSSLRSVAVVAARIQQRYLDLALYLGFILGSGGNL